MWQNNTVHDTKRHVPSQQNLFHRLSQLFLQAVDIHPGRVQSNLPSHDSRRSIRAVVAAHFTRSLAPYRFPSEILSISLHFVPFFLPIFSLNPCFLVSSLDLCFLILAFDLCFLIFAFDLCFRSLLSVFSPDLYFFLSHFYSHNIRSTSSFTWNLISIPAKESP